MKSSVNWKMCIRDRLIIAFMMNQNLNAATAPKYSEVITRFENMEVEAFSLKLENGRLDMKLNKEYNLSLIHL